MSNLRVSVEWQKKAIFAGETLACVISFENTEQISESKPIDSQTRNHDSARERWKDDGITDSLRQLSQYSHPQGSSTTFRKAHRNTASLDQLHDTTSTPLRPDLRTQVGDEQDATVRRHGRSVSIVSIGSDTILPKNKSTSTPALRRPDQKHSRVASLQDVPTQYTSSAEDQRPRLPPTKVLAYVQSHGQLSSPDHIATISPKPGDHMSSKFDGKEACINSSTQVANSESSLTLAKPHDKTFAEPSHSDRLLHFPLLASMAPRQARDGSNEEIDTTPAPSPAQQQSNQAWGALNDLSTTFQPTRNEGTPRSSTDVHSISNKSSDTFTSECFGPEIGQNIHQSIPRKQRRRSLLYRSRQRPESLMMGYSNICGAFSVDPSLVNASHFDEVKRKAVVGHEGGGGVVRTESAKRQSGLLGSFGWNTLGESLGGLLGGGEVSSIKGKTNDEKWIPLISTPQTLLFIDLRLEPGQSQSYSYSYRLPPRLPPTYKGKAMKVSYSLTIGVQMATQSVQRHIVRRFDFAFRVLPSVHGNGNSMSHNLMSPYIMLHSEPFVSPIKGFSKGSADFTRAAPQSDGPHSDQDLLLYISRLLENPPRESNAGLLSPSVIEANTHVGSYEEPATVQDAVTRAVQQSNPVGPFKLSPNRFIIARGGNRVAAIMLARAAYRIGETIPMAICFNASAIQCHSLRVTLETAERVDPTIALRSQASILRISRRIHAMRHDSSISADRVCLNLAIPGNSTPDFKTSGISLEWFLRYEFVTCKHIAHDEEHLSNSDGLLEETAGDERGTVFAAAQTLSCESFEVQLPLRVYGDPRGLDERYKLEEHPV
ncbi:MAG: hypothetical protein Q9219_007712 [cf. Caloplaca sp. 3 TL-2023]